MRANKTPLIATLFAAALALTGCVNSDIERAGIGAATGAVAAAAFDGNIATGVLLGAGAGALCDDVNLC